MPDIFYELNKSRKKQRIDTLVARLTVIMFVLGQIPIFLVFAIGKHPNMTYAIVIEIAIIISATLIYFKKTTLAVCWTALFFYMFFGIVPHVFESYHYTIPIVMGTFILGTYVFEEKLLRRFNFIGFITALVLYYTALYSAYDIFYEFILDSSIGIISFIVIYLILRYFKADVEKYDEKLQEVNNFLTEITDLNPHFIYAKDSDDKFIFINETMARFYGHLPHEMIGEKVDKYYENSEIVEYKNNTEAEKNNRIKQLVTVLGMDDEPTFHELIQTSMLDDNGEYKGMFGVAINVTERKKAENALRESEQRYRQLYENHQMGIISVKRGRFSTVNDTFCVMTGYARAEIIGEKIIGIIHPDDYEATLTKTKQVDLGKSKGEVFEHRFIRKDGTIGYALIHHQLLSTQGKPIEAIATLTDISEHKATEKALRKSETIYRTLIENTFDGIEILESTPPKKEGDKWNEQLIARNNRVYEILGKIKSDIKLTALKTKDILEMSPETQPNGKKSHEYIQELSDKLKEKSIIKFEWQYGKEKHVIDIEMTIIKFDIEGKKYVTRIFKDITKSKKAAYEIKRREAFYRSIFNYAYDGIEIYEVGDDVIFPIDRNERFREMLGRTDEELEGYKGLEISPKYQSDGKSTETLRSEQVEILKQTGKTQYEWRAIHKDGHYIDLQVTSVRFDLHGKSIITSMYRDLTEQKKAEITLRESEAMYRHLFENAFDGIEIYEFFSDTGKTGKLLQRNEKLRKLLGRKDSELQGKKQASMLELSPEIQSDGTTSTDVLEAIRQEFKKRGKVDTEWRFMHAQNYPIDVRLSVHTFDVGNKSVYIGIYKNITEKKKAEIALRESEALYRNLFENAFDGIEIYEYSTEANSSPKSQLLARNDKLRNLLGRTNEEIGGNEAASVIRLSPEFQSNGQRSFEHFRQMQEKFNETLNTAFEWRFSHKKGHAVDVYLTLKEYNINNKTILIGIYKDITEQKKAEQTIQKNIQQLQQKNEELQKFIKSNMQLENFAYLASHDLKEPIRTIVSFSQLLKHSTKDKLSKDELEYIDFIIKGSKNMSMLIEDLLAYSRVNTENKNIQPIKVSDMLYTINYELNTLIENKKAKIETANLPETIEADRVQMRQLFQNLITNAIRYSAPERAPNIHISAQENEQEWLFTVSDNGIGIKPEFYERIFLLFRKLHNERDKGTGIGLALCKTIVENHGGRIWIESEYDKGSNFYFTIKKNLME